MVFNNQQAYPVGLLGNNFAGSPGPSPLFTVPGGTMVSTPNQRYLDQYGSYGFAPELQNYLAQQAQLATMDGGVAYQYDPTTQTFTGSTLGGPVSVSMAEMMQRVNQAQQPATFGLTATPSPAFTGAVAPITPSQGIGAVTPMYSSQGIGTSMGSAMAQPQSVSNQQSFQPFNPQSFSQQLQGTNNSQAFPPFNYSNFYQQPNLYNQFSSPFAMRPMFAQLGLSGFGGAQY